LSKETEIIYYERKKMPVYGCMLRRKYLEALVNDKKKASDPCLFCEERATCFSNPVTFNAET